MRHSYGVDFQYSFSGDFYETPYISLNIKQNHSNWLAVNSFVKDLFAKGTKLRFADIGKYDDSLVSDKSIEAARFFENVSKEDISDFMETYDFGIKLLDLRSTECRQTISHSPF